MIGYLLKVADGFEAFREDDSCDKELRAEVLECRAPQPAVGDVLALQE